VLGCETADHDHIGILGRVAGKPALKNILTEQWKSVTNRSLEIVDQETIPLGKDSLVSLTHWKYAFSTPDGKRQEFKLRMTRVMKREEGKLRITTEHVSIGIPPPPQPAAK
jgi:ketosteroid isomerase-like protein